MCKALGQGIASLPRWRALPRPGNTECTLYTGTSVAGSFSGDLETVGGHQGDCRQGEPSVLWGSLASPLGP